MDKKELADNVDVYIDMLKHPPRMIKYSLNEYISDILLDFLSDLKEFLMKDERIDNDETS